MPSNKAAAMVPEEVSQALSINVLQDMVKNLEETKLKLLLNIKELKDKLNQQKEDQSDIYYYLNKKCDESFEVIASLEEQILNEQTDREIAEKLYESKIEEIKQVAQSTELKLNAKIIDLESRLEMLKSFNESKGEMEENLNQLMNTLQEEREQFHVNAEGMENKFLLEREKLRKSYDLKYQNIKKEMESTIESKLSKKTKKTQVMNIVMKQELENQSKNAEKLLEINQNIINKDKNLSLELKIAKSLEDELTVQLARNQRNIKQLNEKISNSEVELENAELRHRQQLSEKNEERIKLEAKITQLGKRSSVENQRMDEMWTFLSNSYQLLKAKTDTSFMVRRVSSDGSFDHDKLLQELIREVLHKFPKLINQLNLSDNNQNKLLPLSPQSLARSQSVAESVAGSSVSSLKGGSQYSLVTGIPSWDANASDLKKSRPGKTRGSKTRTVSVQTEGKLAPYPEGSVWLEAPGIRSLMMESEEGVIKSSYPPVDNSSDHDSANGAPGGGGGSLSQISMETDENYTIQAASYVLPSHSQTPMKRAGRNRQTGKARKLRSKSHNTYPYSMAPGQEDEDSLTHSVGNSLASSSLATHKTDIMVQPHPPTGRSHLTKYSSRENAPRNLSLGLQMVHPTMSTSLPKHGPASHMAISGQGFVAPPLVLPKL